MTARHTPKIGAGQKPALPYEYDSALNMHILGPGEPAATEWRAAGLRQPDMAAIREYRLGRVQAELRARNIAAAVLTDPLNIRYAADSTNMQLWTAHNAARYCVAVADGPMIVFDYHQCEHLSAHNPLIDEIRPATSWFYFSSGGELENHAKKWAGEIADIVRQNAPGNSRIACDKINPEGADALRALGFDIKNGEELMENARMIKCDEEIQAMRCAIFACEKAMDLMREDAVPGNSENKLWARFYSECLARGSEWIETRLLAAGPRTNPWFQECSSRPMRRGEIVAFDTDLIGAFGMCVDISRSWTVGGEKPSAAQADLHRRAVEQVRRNAELLRPGAGFREISEKALVWPEDEYRRYSSLWHGVGLCDEYPAVSFPSSWAEGGYDGEVLPGMVFCSESYVGRKDGGEGVKFEEQVLVTENGPEILSSFPEGLLGE